MKQLFRLSALIMAGLFVQAAYAEDGCPSGMQPYQPQQGLGAPNWSCMPIPGYSNGNSSSAPPPPPVRWEDRYGSLVFGVDSRGIGVLGTSKNKTSSNTAENAAMQDCISQKGTDCRVRLTYHNQCAAVVWGPSGGSSAGGPTLEKAIQVATEDCNKNSRDCRTYYTGCSMPVQVQ